MKNIASIFKIIFNTKEFTDINVLCFAEDHLLRIMKNDIAGTYDSMQKDTSKYFYKLYELHQKKEKARLLKSELTQEVKNISESLKESIRKLEGLLRSQLAKDSEVFLSVFPNGLSEYCRLNRSNTQSLMTRILIFLKENHDLVTPMISKEITSLYALYQDKRKEQLNIIQKHDEIVNEKKVARKNLSFQLQKNVYLLAIDYLGQLDKADVFFDQKLLLSQNLKNFENGKWEKLKFELGK